MKVFFLCGVLVLSFSCFQQSANAQEVTLPAGSLLNCTLDEPNFSSASAQAGDPVICHARGVQQFGHAVFPRGAYLAGHLADSRDPGHFWGKGWLKLEFDRISLPDTTLPVPGKIVAVRGYRVDREGKIIGHGHPRRDAIEWLIPPLWPWKLVTLPARGPRPTLKGETQVTLRLMDDVAVPTGAAASRPAAAGPAALGTKPWRPPVESSARPVNGSLPIRYLPPSIPAMQSEAGGTAGTVSSAAPAAESVLATGPPPAQLTLIALKGEAIYAATDYWIEGRHSSTPSAGSRSLCALGRAFIRELSTTDRPNAPTPGYVPTVPYGEAHHSFLEYWPISWMGKAHTKVFSVRP